MTDCVDLALRTLNPPDIRIESVDQTGEATRDPTGFPMYSSEPREGGS